MSLRSSKRIDNSQIFTENSTEDGVDFQNLIKSLMEVINLHLRDSSKFEVFFFFFFLNF